MVTLTLPCPLWEGAFGDLREVPHATAAAGLMQLSTQKASLAPPPALLKAGPQPSQSWLQRWTPAHASACRLSNSDLVATDAFSSRASAHSTPSFAIGLCNDESLELRRAGAESDLSRASFDDDLPFRRRSRDPSGRESFDDLSTIMTTSRSEYGACASASSWSSRSYTSNIGSSYDSRTECSSVGPGLSWIGRSRTPSPEMGRAAALEVHETPPRRLRMSARQPSPPAKFAGGRPQVTRLPLSASQVYGAQGQGLSKSSARTAICPLG